MAALSSKLRSWSNPNNQDRGVSYWCQGCQQLHSIKTAGNPSWSWNGDALKPVFSPSVLVQTYDYPTPYRPDDDPEHAQIRERFEQGGDVDWMMNHPKWGRRCHTFVGCNGALPGQVIFLNDCTHALAGTVQDFPDLPQDYV